MFDQIFVSPQVKRSVIICNKRGIYKLPHELGLGLGLGFYEIRKCQGNLEISLNHSLVPSLSPKIKILSITEKNC